MAKASVRDRNAVRTPVIRNWSRETPFYSRRFQRVLGMAAARRHHTTSLRGLNRFLRQRQRGSNPMAAKPRPARIPGMQEILASLATKKESR